MFRELLPTAMALVLLATFGGGLAIVAAQLAAKDVHSAALHAQRRVARIAVIRPAVRAVSASSIDATPWLVAVAEAQRTTIVRRQDGARRGFRERVSELQTLQGLSARRFRVPFGVSESRFRALRGTTAWILATS